MESLYGVKGSVVCAVDLIKGLGLCLGWQHIPVPTATGGMVTKLHAAQIATASGCEMVIANGEKPEVLYDIVAGRRAGTRFLIPHS